MAAVLSVSSRHGRQALVSKLEDAALDELTTALVLLRSLGYWTAKLLLPIVSAGRLEVLPAPRYQSGSWMMRKGSPNPKAFSRLLNGKIGIHPVIGAYLGLLIWAALVVTMLAYL
jgi:hypothetical protein